MSVCLISVSPSLVHHGSHVSSSLVTELRHTNQSKLHETELSPQTVTSKSCPAISQFHSLSQWLQGKKLTVYKQYQQSACHTRTTYLCFEVCLSAGIKCLPSSTQTTVGLTLVHSLLLFRFRRAFLYPPPSKANPAPICMFKLPVQMCLHY